MKENKIKNQHIVPRFYLKSFSSDKKTIHAYDIIQKKRLRPNPNIRNVASEKYFYDFIDDEKQKLEKQLANIEDICKNIIDDLIENVNNRKKLTIIDKEKLVFITTLQFIRSKEIREDLSKIYQFLLKHNQTPFKENIIFKNRQEAHLSFMTNNQIFLDFYNTIMNHILLIGVNLTSKLLYTSDNPVVRYNHNDNRNPGIQAPGTEIIFPITPHIVVIFLEKSVSSNMVKNNMKKIVLKDDRIQFYNELQFKTCTRHVFSFDGNFSLLRLLAKDFNREKDSLRIKEFKK